LDRTVDELRVNPEQAPPERAGQWFDKLTTTSAAEESLD